MLKDIEDLVAEIDQFKANISGSQKLITTLGSLAASYERQLVVTQELQTQLGKESRNNQEALLAGLAANHEKQVALVQELQNRLAAGQEEQATVVQELQNRLAAGQEEQATLVKELQNQLVTESQHTQEVFLNKLAASHKETVSELESVNGSLYFCVRTLKSVKILSIVACSFMFIMIALLIALFLNF